MDLTEAEDMKKRWQEYTELYKKYLHDPDNHSGVITHLEPDILKCEIVSNNFDLPVPNSAVATGLEKVNFHSNPKERQCQRMLKLLHNCTHLTC